MNKFLITKNGFLSRDVPAFYHTDYIRANEQNKPNYLNILKNDYNTARKLVLDNAMCELRDVLLENLPQLANEIEELLPNLKMTICLVPRAKADNYYTNEQLRFRYTLNYVVNLLPSFANGIDYIKRTSNTRTTHLKEYDKEGLDFEAGISLKTCRFAEEIKDKNILLIDDIYTKSKNIDEDFIEALYKKGAKNVIFYAIGKTVFNGYR